MKITGAVVLVTVIYAANQPLTVDQRIWVAEKCHQIKGINLAANTPGSGRISELFLRNLVSAYRVNAKLRRTK
jgi:hypothetical protein